MTPARSMRPAPPPIPELVLVIAGSFGERLSGESVANALARGLRAGGVAATEPWALDGRALQAGELEASLRLARAVVVAERRLQERTLQASAAFEIATRARQAGVPAYAVTSENRLDRFDARMLDLQLILEASTTRALQAAGRRLAERL